MKKITFLLLLLVFSPPAVLQADLRMVVRELAWGGKRKDTLTVWKTAMIRLNTARVRRGFSTAGGFKDTTEILPNYTDSVFYLMSSGRRFFCRSLAKDSAVWAERLPLTLSGGVLHQKFLTDKRRVADTLCSHYQWVWEKCRLDSASRPVASADLEIDFWLPQKGFKGKEDLEFFNDFRRKKFGGRGVLEGIEAARISSALGIRLLEFERQAKAKNVFPLEMKVTLRRKLSAGQKEYFFQMQTMEFHIERMRAADFMVPTGYERLNPSDRKPPARTRKK